MEYDAIIVGAGPAGATTGYHLAKAGFHILLLEKERLPRYKPCAGAIAARTLDLLDFDISFALEKAVHNIYFTYKLGGGHLLSAQLPLAYTVMRDKFDYLLTEKAIQSGVDVVQEAKVIEADILAHGVTVTTRDNQFRGQILVGADGSKSTVAKLLGLNDSRRLVITIQSEVFVDSHNMAENSSRLWVDIGSVPYGYAWVFPKFDHLSMGIGVFQKRAYNIKSQFWKCLKGMLPQYQDIQTYVRPLSIWSNRRKLSSYRAILVGDAAGIVDPLTGEGIYYAIRSGIIAAEVISQCLSKRYYDMTRYEVTIKSELGKSLRDAMVSSAFFYAFPRLTYRVGLCNNNITTYFAQMMQTFDERTYKGLLAHGVMGL